MMKEMICILFDGRVNELKINKIVDLTMMLHNDLPVYPGDPKPNIHAATTIENEGYHTSFLHLGSHTGTHVDAPFHFREEGKTIENIELSRFVGEGVVIKVTDKSPGQAITLEDIAPYTNEINKDTVVLFHTGWSKYIENELYYEHPYVEIQAVEELLQLGVRTFFIDALNIDPPSGEHFSAHSAITKMNGIIGENFTNFEQITFKRPLIVALPLKIAGGDGSPIRAIAIDLN